MNQNDFFEQATQITKAYGYDILAAQVKELKAENDQLRSEVERTKIMLKWAEERVKLYQELANDIKQAASDSFSNLLEETKDDLKDINI